MRKYGFQKDGLSIILHKTVLNEKKFETTFGIDCFFKNNPAVFIVQKIFADLEVINGCINLYL